MHLRKFRGNRASFSDFWQWSVQDLLLSPILYLGFSVLRELANKSDCLANFEIENHVFFNVSTLTVFSISRDYLFLINFIKLISGRAIFFFIRIGLHLDLIKKFVAPKSLKTAAICSIPMQIILSVL